MYEATYEEVVRLAEQLTPEEQKALASYLQELSKAPEPTSKVWEALFDSMKIATPLSERFSLCRGYEAIRR